MFKYLAQANRLQVSLVRGSASDIEHGWNEYEDELLGTCVVDLMHRPGSLYVAGSVEAEAYLKRDPSMEPAQFARPGAPAG